MGTDSGSALVLPGVSDPIINDLSVDGINLSMYHPCVVTGCKDPGNGYINEVYYAEWSVWGRKYNPYYMPFNSINIPFVIENWTHVI